MGRESRRFERAQQPRRLAPWILLIASACANSRDPGGAWRAPSDSGERPTGCIDTPFIGPDQRSGAGVSCGREASPDAALLRGRVVVETPTGLPGAGVEGVWVSVHAGAGGLQLDRLPAPRAETQTGPQGAYTLPLGGAGEYVIAARADRGGAILAAQRLVLRAGEAPPELILRVLASE